MNKLKSWTVSIAFGLLWVGLRQLYGWVQGSWQAEFLSSGLSRIWWAITLAYFVADAALVLTFIYVGNEPLGRPMPKGFPFWYLATDTVILVFLVHLSFVCIDHPVYVQLESIGLSFAYLIFLAGAALWAVIAGLKYLSVRRLYLRER